MSASWPSCASVHISTFAYVKAAGSDGLVTDASWLCEVDASINFADIGFDDSGWTPAKLKETNDPVLNTSSASLPVNAQWLTQSSAISSVNVQTTHWYAQYIIQR
jgi:hypothetical protein